MTRILTKRNILDKNSYQDKNSWQEFLPRQKFLTIILTKNILLTILTSNNLLVLSNFLLKTSNFFRKTRIWILQCTLAALESNPNYWSTKCQTLSEIARNTLTQQPLARLHNLLSVLTVILHINMSIPFNLILVRILLPI